MTVLHDVSHPVWAGMPKIPVLPEVGVDPVTSIDAGQPLNISLLHLATHAGTHIDAPRHALADGATIDEVPVDRFVSPGVVVAVNRGPGEEIPVEDVAAADVRRGDVVLLSTGWARHFEAPEYNDHPYPSVALAEWLVETGVNMLGVDCITVDAPVERRGPGFDYPVHRTLLGSGVLIIENLADLAPFAGQRVVVHAAPLAVRAGDAGHARVLLEVTA
ncbi:MAG TPA: cyclase family protein [Acidimicrobiales bacterium]